MYKMATNGQTIDTERYDIHITHTHIYIYIYIQCNLFKSAQVSSLAGGWLVGIGARCFACPANWDGM